MIGFKIYISRTAESRFRYYKPTPEEAETERQMAMGEKRTRQSEMERRFLHPALQQHKLYQVMVHKSQEALAREVLSAYPWFAGKHQHDGVEIKAIREDNLEYDPNKAANDTNWDARSVASTDMLGGGKSGYATPITPGDELYKQWPLPSQGEYSHYPLPTNDTSAFNSTVNLPLDNPSTDHLILQQGRSEQFTPRRQASRTYPSDSIAAAPLLDHVQPTPLSPATGGGSAVPYPPVSFTSPPVGYTPPGMQRSHTSQSMASDASWDRGDLGAPPSSQYAYAYNQPPPSYGHSRTPVSGGSGGSSRAPTRMASPTAYQDPYDAYDRMMGPPGVGAAGQQGHGGARY